MVKWITRPSHQKIKGWNPRSADHFHGRWWFAFVRLDTTAQLVKSYVVLCQPKFQDHDFWSSLVVVGYEAHPFLYTGIRHVIKKRIIPLKQYTFVPIQRQAVPMPCSLLGSVNERSIKVFTMYSLFEIVPPHHNKSDTVTWRMWRTNKIKP